MKPSSRKRGTRGDRGRAPATPAERAEQSRRRALRRRAGQALLLVALVMAVTHLFEHAGVLRFMPLGAEDLLLGWPMAGLLAIVAANAGWPRGR